MNLSEEKAAAAAAMRVAEFVTTLEKGSIDVQERKNGHITPGAFAAPLDIVPDDIDQDASDWSFDSDFDSDSNSSSTESFCGEEIAGDNERTGFSIQAGDPKPYSVLPQGVYASDGEDGVRAWFESLCLEEYASAFIDQGFVSMVQFLELRFPGDLPKLRPAIDSFGDRDNERRILLQAISEFELHNLDASGLRPAGHSPICRLEFKINGASLDELLPSQVDELSAVLKSTARVSQHEFDQDIKLSLGRADIRGRDCFRGAMLGTRSQLCEARANLRHVDSERSLLAVFLDARARKNEHIPKRRQRRKNS